MLLEYQLLQRPTLCIHPSMFIPYRARPVSWSIVVISLTHIASYMPRTISVTNCSITLTAITET